MPPSRKTSLSRRDMTVAGSVAGTITEVVGNALSPRRAKLDANKKLAPNKKPKNPMAPPPPPAAKIEQKLALIDQHPAPPGDTEEDVQIVGGDAETNHPPTPDQNVNNNVNKASTSTKSSTRSQMKTSNTL